MPPKRQQDVQDGEARQPKRARKDGDVAPMPVPTPVFRNAAALSAALHANTPAQLAINLNQLRSYAAARDVDEERLKLLAEWISGPGVRDVEAVLDSSHNASSILNPLFSFLSSVLYILRRHPEHNALTTGLGNLLLSDRQVERLNRAVRQDDASLVLSCMKVWLELVSVETLQSRVASVWNWGGKLGTKLLSMRRRGKFNSADDPLQKADIRTLYILFLLSFLSPTTPASLKQSFLAQKETFTTIFRDLRRDPTSVVRKVLEVSWDGIWEDKRVRRTVKIGIFNEWLLSQILRLYERQDKDNPSDPFSAADLAHHFLLAICTRPGSGICFPDDGWYPREAAFGEDGAPAVDEDEPSEGRSQKGRIYNKILANFLKVLRVGEDARQQELALKILEACPELVTGYWPTANISLEPRLSSRWLINAAFLGRVVSLPVPTSCFRLPSSSRLLGSSEASYRPDPPPLAPLLANTFPSIFNRVHLSKGLQAKQGLVQLFTAQTLARCLEKFEQVRTEMIKIEKELDEDPDDGQWRLRRLELQDAARGRAPDFSVVIAFSQQKIEGDDKAARKKRAMLKEVALRLLWCYQRSLLDIVAESRFDAGKLFRPGSITPPSGSDDDEKEEMEELNALSQLHVLRLLRNSDQFNWSARAPGSTHTFLYHFLLMRARSPHAAVRAASEDLVQHLLGTSLLFEHDPDELRLWLEALPSSTRDSTIVGPDGAVLTDEAEGVITLLDDCVHRCLRTPYRYVEELSSLLTTEDNASVPLSVRAPLLPSPLLVTVLEQLKAKHKAGTISFSDTMASLAFLRHLILGITGKEENFTTPVLLNNRLRVIIQSFADDHPGKPDEVVRSEQLYFSKEVHLLSDNLDKLSDPDCPVPSTSFASAPFLEADMDALPNSAGHDPPSASQLVDQYRLLQEPLPGEDVKLLVQLVAERSNHGSELWTLLSLLNPKTENLWRVFSAVELASILEDAPSSFWVAFRHADSQVLMGKETSALLAKLAAPLLQDRYKSMLVFKCILAQLSAIIDKAEERSRSMSGSLHLLTSLGGTSVPQQVQHGLKTLLFVESGVMRKILSDPVLFSEDAAGLVKACLEALSESDSALAAPYAEICMHETVNHRLDNEVWLSCWVPFMTLPQLISLASWLLNGTNLEHIRKDMLAEVVNTLARRREADISPVLRVLPSILQQPRLCEEDTIRSSLKSFFAFALPLQQDENEFFTNQSLAMLGFSSAQHFQQTIRWHATPVDVDSVVVGAIPALTFALYQSPSLRNMALETVLHGDSHAEHDSSLSRLCCLLEAETFLGAGLRSARLPEVAETWLKDITIRLFTSTDEDELLPACCEALRHYAALAGPANIFGQIEHAIPPSAPLSYNRHSLQFVKWASSTYEKEFRSPLVAFVDGVLRWLVRRFSEDVSDSIHLLKGLKPFSEVLESHSDLKRHLVEPVLTSILRSRFTVLEAVDLASTLCEHANLPDDVASRFLQSVLNHSHLRQAASVSTPRLRRAIVRLIHTLSSSQPQAACQPGQMRQIVSLYGGTLSLADRMLLSLLGLFEKQRSSSAAILLSANSPGSARPMDLILSLDATQIFKTCLEFPHWRDFDTAMDYDEAKDRPDAYDPVYVLGLLGAGLSQDTLNGLDWVALCRTGVLSLAVCGLASTKPRMRKVAFTLLAATHTAIRQTEFFERDQLLYNLQLVRNVLPSESEPPRLPTFTVLLVAHAVHSLFHPTVLVYPHVSKFLLQRPTLDTTDIPMLYSMLYSSSDDHRRERLWMVRYLSNGMKSIADWRAMRRRRAWDLLATLFHSEADDRQLRSAIFEVLGSLTRNQYATHALVLRSTLLAWINVQLLTPKAVEAISWLRVLENIVMVVDHDKLEKDTSATWREDVCSCIRKVLGCVTPEAGALHSAYIAARIMLRLSLYHAGPPRSMRDLLDRSVSTLQAVEKSLGDVPPPGPYSAENEEKEQYHRFIAEAPPALSPEETADLYAFCVRKLWRVGMTLPTEKDEDMTRSRRQWWMQLTPRVIVLGEAGGEEAQWARREVLRNIVLRSVGDDGAQ